MEGDFISALTLPGMPENKLKPEEVIAQGVEYAGRLVAHAIFPNFVIPGPGANGGHVASLTEAIVDVAAGLKEIASAVHDVADALRGIADSR